MPDPLDSLREQFARNHGHREHLARRVLAELEFAAGLAELHDDDAWRQLAAEARTEASKALARPDADLAAVCEHVEGLLAPIAETAGSYTLHCLGHAHIDMNWQWGWAETVATIQDTFTTVLRLMEEFPDFCFGQSQTAVYRAVKEYCPELFEKILSRVAEGRWEVTAPQWVEGDKNLPTGEAIARHLLYSRRYLAETMNLSPEQVPLDWQPDTFGHAATIPSILTRGGVSRYYMCRGGQFDKPPVFWWRGPDGSRVLVNLESAWYNDVVGPHNARGMLAFARETGMRDWLLVYGIGDHGGGPTRRDLRMIAEMDSWPVFPNFRMNTSEAYFRLLEQRGDQWPTLEGELNYEFPGCYSSQSLIKRTNRLAEWALVRCEWAACLAEAAGLMAYPAEKIVESWRRTLFGHFHDILPGSCVAAARDYHAGQYQLTAAQTGIDQTRAYRALAAEMDLRFAAAGRPERPARAVSAEPVGFGGGVGRDSEDASVSSAGHAGGDERYFVVFNPSPFPRSEVVRLATWDSELGDVQKRNYTAVFPDGVERPVQRIDKGMYWGHEYIDLAVPVRVPAGGWTAVALRDEGLAADIKHIDSGYDPAKDPRDDSAASTLRTAATERHQRFGPAFSQERWLENEHLRAEFDNETGCLRRLLDKRTGLELIDPDRPAGCEYLIERPGPMSSWRIFDPRRRQFPLEMVSFEPLMCGMWEQTPWQVGYVCQQRAGETTVRTTWRLEEGSDRLEVQIDCDWRQRGGPEAGTPSLRFRLPVAVDGACLACECPSGSVVRRDDPNQEVPSQTWVDVRGETPSGQPAGMAVYNDACYSWRLGEGVLTATLLRSSYQPDPLPEFGPKRFRLALAPHATAPNAAELMRRGAAFNQPLQVVTAEEHEGSLPARSGEMLSVEPENVLLTACKRAEDGRGWVVRLLETAGRETAATVRLGSDLPGEVVSAVETDLLERPRDGGTAAAAEDGFTVTLAPFAIASVRLERK